MIEYVDWYNDQDIGIYFSEEPKVCIQYVHPDTPKKVKEQINKKPFINRSKLHVVLIDRTDYERYEFDIPEGYTWDGASIPRMFWRLIGPKTDPKFLIPSMIHDVLCENHDYVNGDRYFATIVFERLLYVSGVNRFSRWMMKHSVDNFQKFCKWEKCE